MILTTRLIVPRKEMKNDSKRVKYSTPRSAESIIRQLRLVNNFHRLNGVVHPDAREINSSGRQIAGDLIP